MTSSTDNHVRRELSTLFGLYKAEWMNGHLFELFTEPDYFGELRTQCPCVLIGGRGTGKTTVLRGLSYEGQFALSGQAIDAIATWPYYGLYYRADTNRVRALTGSDVPIERWIRLFAHYFNLQLCELLLDFARWYELRRASPVVLPRSALNRIATSLNLSTLDSLPDLYDQLTVARLRFEAFINNMETAERPRLSLQKSPVRRTGRRPRWPSRVFAQAVLLLA